MYLGIAFIIVAGWAAMEVAVIHRKRMAGVYPKISAWTMVWGCVLMALAWPVLVPVILRDVRRGWDSANR
jgi:hypothetical protein